MFQLYAFFPFLILRSLHRGQSFRASHVLENVLLQWQCYCLQFSLGMILPFMPGINPWLWAISRVCIFSLLIFLKRQCYLVSIFSTVNSKAISTIPTLLFSSVPCRCFWPEKDLWGLASKLPVGVRKRDKRTGLIWTALIWFPKREIPFHLMHPYCPKRCSCTVELTLEDTAELHRGASCMGLPMTVLSHCRSPTHHEKMLFSPWHHFEVIIGSSMKRKRVVSIKT